VSQYQKGKINLDFTEANDSEWQWHQLGHMQVCTPRSRQITTPAHHHCFLQAGCPSCCPTNSVKALNASVVLPTASTTTENEKCRQDRSIGTAFNVMQCG